MKSFSVFVICCLYLQAAAQENQTSASNASTTTGDLSMFTKVSMNTKCV